MTPKALNLSGGTDAALPACINEMQVTEQLQIGCGEELVRYKAH